MEMFGYMPVENERVLMRDAQRDDMRNELRDLIAELRRRYGRRHVFHVSDVINVARDLGYEPFAAPQRQLFNRLRLRFGQAPPPTPEDEMERFMPMDLHDRVDLRAPNSDGKKRRAVEVIDLTGDDE